MSSPAFWWGGIILEVKTLSVGHSFQESNGKEDKREIRPGRKRISKMTGLLFKDGRNLNVSEFERKEPRDMERLQAPEKGHNPQVHYGGGYSGQNPGNSGGNSLSQNKCFLWQQFLVCGRSWRNSKKWTSISSDHSSISGPTTIKCRKFLGLTSLSISFWFLSYMPLYSNSRACSLLSQLHTSIHLQIFLLNCS